jgi:multisubunit Na+/H+ antiporter MnhE subunit
LKNQKQLAIKKLFAVLALLKSFFCIFISSYLFIFLSLFRLKKNSSGLIVEVATERFPCVSLLQTLITLSPGTIAYSGSDSLIKIHVLEFSSDLIEFIKKYLFIFGIEDLFFRVFQIHEESSSIEDRGV